MEEMRTLPAYSDRFWELRPRRAALKQKVTEEWLAALRYDAYRLLFSDVPRERRLRWRLLLEFIETWHGPLGESPGYSEAEIEAAEQRLGVRLPAAVREWYELAGKAQCHLTRQFRRLDDIRPPERGSLCFMETDETRYRVHLESGDDPVTLRDIDLGTWGSDIIFDDDDEDEAPPPLPSQPTFTCFIFATVFDRAISASNCVKWRRWDDATAREVAVRFAKLSAWSPEVTHGQYWESDSMLCSTESYNSGTMLFGARDEGAFLQFSDQIRSELRTVTWLS
jgi:hypothetical protein